MAVVGNIFGKFLGEFWAHLYNFHEAVDDTLPLENPAAADDSIGAQETSAWEAIQQSTVVEAQAESSVAQGVQAGPLEDTAAAAAEEIGGAWISDPIEAELFDIAAFMEARAPPDDEEDLLPSSAVSDPFTNPEAADDGTQAPPTDQDEEDIFAGEFGSALDAPDALDGFEAAPLEDEPAAQDEIGASSIGEALDEAPSVDGLTASPQDDPGCVFPSITDVTTSTEDTLVSSHDITLPSGITSGQRLIAILGTTNASTVSVWPAGWTELIDDGFTAVGAALVTAAYRDADGTEPGSITVTRSSTSATSASAVIRLAAGSFDPLQAPEVSAVDSGQGSSSSPDSASVTPSWGSDKTLWLSAFGAGNDPARTISTYPSSYDIAQTYVAANSPGLSESYIGVAGRNLEAASEDPGSYAISASDVWVAITIAVRGACPEDTTAGGREVGDVLAAHEAIEGFEFGPLEDVPPDEDRAGSELGEAAAGDEWLDGATGSPLHDFPPDDDRTGSSTDAPQDFAPPFIEGVSAWPLADEEPAVGPVPGPVELGGGGPGWWITGKRHKREVKWPDLPKPPPVPPWRLKVVQPRDARLRIAAVERNWKIKKRRARREEDMIVLSIIAALLAEQGDDDAS